MPDQKNKTKKKKTLKQIRCEEVKELLKKKDNRYRQPRPLGTTYASIQYRNTDTPQKQEILKKNLQQLIINQYVAQGMRMNDKIYNIAELSGYLDLSPEQTLRLLNKTIARVSMMMQGKDGADMARALYFQALNFAAESQALAMNQVRILGHRQGDNYVPFLSSALNQAIANLPGALKPTIELLRLNMESAKLKPPEPNDFHKQYMSPDEAIVMIREANQSVLENGTLLEQKLLEHTPPEGLPEIRANHQDLTGIGIKAKKEVEGPNEASTPTQIEPKEHTERRAPTLIMDDETGDVE